MSLLPPAPHASELDARTGDGLALTAAMLAAQRAGSDAHLVILRILVQVRADFLTDTGAFLSCHFYFQLHSRDDDSPLLNLVSTPTSLLA